MTDANGGPLHTFTHEGRRYAFSRLTPALLAEYERWVRRRLVATWEGLRGTVPEAEHSEAMGVILDRVAAGELTFPAPAILAVMQTQPGMVRFLELLLGASRLEAFEVIMGAGPDVQAGLKAVLADHRGGAKKEDADGEAAG